MNKLEIHKTIPLDWKSMLEPKDLEHLAENGVHNTLDLCDQMDFLLNTMIPDWHSKRVMGCWECYHIGVRLGLVDKKSKYK